MERVWRGITHWLDQKYQERILVPLGAILWTERANPGGKDGSIHGEDPHTDEATINGKKGPKQRTVLGDDAVSFDHQNESLDLWL